MKDIRPSPIAGRWYPANPDRLAQSVDNYIHNAQIPEIKGEIVGIIAPHAGYQYSGSVAGHAFAALTGKTPQLVVVVSPMHYPYYQSLLTTGHDAYQTPLGTIPVDTDALAILNENLTSLLGHTLHTVRNDEEHSLEIELPFLQRALSNQFRLLPIMVREVNPRVLKNLGTAIAQTVSTLDAILVASTDLSHFYPQEIANKFDREILKRLEMLDPEFFLKADAEGKGYACGIGAVAAVMWASKILNCDKVVILDYATSGNVTNDFSQVVGYAAAAIIRTKQSTEH
jgi:AmmeMemoRadiSam system protein B